MFSQFLFAILSLPGRYFDDMVIFFLILLTLYGYIKFDILMLSNIRKSLKKLNEGINSLARYHGSNIGKLNDLFNAATASGIKKAWTAYCDDIKHTAIRENAPDIKEYFTLYSIISIPARRKKAEAIPGILVVAGLIGTFMSIMSGITNLDPSSGMVVQDGMKSFLNIMANSFSITIAAMILSILFQIFDRQNYHLTISELNLFLNRISHKIPKANESDSLELLLREVRSQKEVLDKMGVNISAHLSSFIDKKLVPTLYKSFDDTIKNQIYPSIKAMSDMLYQLSEVAYSTQRKGMQTLVDSFTSKLMSTMGLELEKMGERFKNIVECTSRDHENINRLIEKLSANAELQQDVNTQTVMVLETIGSYQHQAVEMNTHLTENIESMRHFNEELREVLKSDRLSIEELNSQRQALKQENSAYFSKMDEQISRLLEDLNVALEAAFLHFNDITLVAFERLDHSLRSSIEGMSNHMKTLTENMDDQVRDISIYARGISAEVGELNTRLESAVTELGNQMKEGVVKTMQTFDDGLGEICSRLGRVISDIKDAVEDLPVIMEKLRNDQEDQREMII